MATVSSHNLRKTYGKTEVLHGLSLDVADGEFVVMLGLSGCGNSTTLGIIAGLGDVPDGEVRIGGQVVEHLEPKDRKIAMVSKKRRDLPVYDRAQNIGFGLRRAKNACRQQARRIEEGAAILSMTDYLDSKPAQLPSGQHQRVALAARWCATRRCFCLTNPCPIWMLSCAARCGWKSRNCTSGCTPR